MTQYIGGFKVSDDGALYVTFDGSVIPVLTGGIILGPATNVFLKSDGTGGLLVRNAADNAAAPILALTVTGTAITATTSMTAPYVVLNGSQPGGLGASKTIIDWQGSGARIFSYGPNGSTNGTITLNSQRSDGTNSLNFLSFSVTGAATFIGHTVAPALAVVSGGASLGSTTTAAKIVKAISAIADNVATDTITVTVPNAAHSAALKLTLKGSLGAGGAIGANEATASISYDVAIARTAGVATVAVASTAYGSATASVAGAATVAITAAASAMTGAVGAQQTFTIQVTIARGSGSSTNHTCQVIAEIINANLTGVTIS